MLWVIVADGERTEKVAVSHGTHAMNDADKEAESFRDDGWVCRCVYKESCRGISQPVAIRTFQPPPPKRAKHHHQQLTPDINLLKQ